MATPLSSSPSRAQILSLFRSLLRTSSKFSDYNIRSYSKRRTIDGFRSNRSLSDSSLISSAFDDGRAQLQAAERQAAVYSMYSSKYDNFVVHIAL
ncbi:uncharacterized protein A4U43_UnF3980 [Asparagus officinalis]|uniref:Complex 1 LYR protein domain-containing protein n=1 Tax=Asparagus officinalis TaxID=4686 RepID=A0A1R3L6Z3_ASPOF|nr:uncharacterized protein A4U43_UnF3980 [Asparagus officinalis]